MLITTRKYTSLFSTSNHGPGSVASPGPEKDRAKVELLQVIAPINKIIASMFVTEELFPSLLFCSAKRVLK